MTSHSEVPGPREFWRGHTTGNYPGCDFQDFFSTSLFSSTKWSQSFSCKVYRNTENGEVFFFSSCSGFSVMNIVKKKLENVT